MNELISELDSSRSAMCEARGHTVPSPNTGELGMCVLWKESRGYSVRMRTLCILLFCAVF